MIAHLITRLSMGGAQQIALNVANKSLDLDEKGLFITGLSNEKSDAPNNYLLEDVNRSLKLEIIEELSDRISLKNDLIALFKIYKILKKNKPKLLHVHSSKTGVLGRFACFFLKTKVVFHVHGWSYSSSNNFKGKVYFFIEWILYFFTDHFIFVCKQDRLDFEKSGKFKNLERKSSVIYPGAEFIDLESIDKTNLEIRQALSIDPNEIVIGNIARLDYQKDPIKFINIAKEIISKSDKNYKFVLIGSGTLENQVKKMVEDFSMQKHFIFTGFIENVEPYFSIFDAFLITSKYEGLPVTAIKAISCKSLIFGFEVNGMKDLNNIFTTVFLTKTRNTENMADLIIEKFENINSLKFFLEKNSQKARQEFYIDNMYNKIFNAYKNLLKL
jgi:glycosyltransferase involved in cell wall biosynthesis